MRSASLRARWILGVAIGGAGCVIGCKTSNDDRPAPSVSPDAEGVRVPELPRTPAPPARRSPLPQAELPTNAAAIAVGNFEGQIAALEKGLSEQPHRADWMRQLAPLYETRAQFFGRPADYGRAEALGEQAVRDAPGEVFAYLLRAETRASLHRFPEALADLDVAEKKGARPAALAGMRAGIDLATGHLDRALAARHAEATARPSLHTIGAEAVVLGELGREADAEDRFIEAQYHFPDVAPFPVAWLYFQEGLLWERAGKLARARELYEAARERLPDFAAAGGHLAGVLAATGDRKTAIALLRGVVEKSDDPEYLGQLAALTDEDGAKAEAGKLRERARAGFEALLAKHPAAFADHAARFYLGAGSGKAIDGKRALALAKENLERRDTAAARELWLDAALVGGTPEVACAAAERALSGCANAATDGGVIPRCSAHLHVLGSRAFTGCKKDARAAEELRAAEGG